MTTQTAFHDTPPTPLRDWTTVDEDPSDDRSMLAIQYTIAIVAVLAAGLLSLVH
jgi:hypothetical protein